MLNFDGRVAVITGASNGIGRECAARLAGLGARVYNLDLHEPQDPGPATYVQCDVTSEESVQAAVDSVVAGEGRVDVAVSNAGVTRDRYLFRMSLDEWNQVLTTHMTGAFLLSRAVQAPMVDAGYGRLLFISSTSALGNRGQVNYSGAKAGVQGMARTLSLELGRFGITVNCVAPGFIETDMTRKVAETSGRSWDEVRQRAVDRSAVGRTGQPADIAAAVAYLTSEQASFVTGQTLYVAGRPTV